MKPSIALQAHREEVREVLERFRMRNPRIFGSTARIEDTDKSDLDILVDVPAGPPSTILPRSRWNWRPFSDAKSRS